MPTRLASRRLIRAPLLLAVLTPLATAACRSPEQAVEFSRGRPISLASWTIRVGQSELMDAPPGGFGDLRVDMTKAHVLAVHVEAEREASPGESFQSSPEYRLLKLMGACLVRDEEGREFRPPLPVPLEQYNMMKGHAVDPDVIRRRFESGDYPRWVLLFAVPRESRGFTLLISNSRPREGQPKLAAVRLGH